MDRLPADAKSRLDTALEAAKAGAPHRRGRRHPHAALDELNAAYSAAGASLYQSAQGQAGRTEGQPAGGPTGEPAAPAQEDVVEADYEIVDDKK